MNICCNAGLRRRSTNFSTSQNDDGPSDAISSALAAAYHRLAFQTLADQVRRSVRSVRGNQWMFRMGHPADHPLRLRPELLQRGADGTYPDPARTHAGAHGPDATAAGATFFSSAWIFPKARGC